MWPGSASSHPLSTTRTGRGGKFGLTWTTRRTFPCFAPIVEELTARGYKVVLTARDAFQVCELAEKKQMRCLKIGRHHGKNKIKKVAGLFFRAAQLAPVALREKPVIGLSHGSRSQILICNLLGIPTVLMADYEYAKYPVFMRPTWEMAPDIVPDSVLSCPGSRVRNTPALRRMFMFRCSAATRLFWTPSV